MDPAAAVHPPTAAHAGKPEAMLLEALRPAYHLCGHHHHPAAFRVGATEVRALNIVTREDGDGRARHALNPGWAYLFDWAPSAVAAAHGGDGGRLTELGGWPPLIPPPAPGGTPALARPPL